MGRYTCIGRTTYSNFDLVLVDHASTEPAARKLIAALADSGQAMVVSFSGSVKGTVRLNPR